MEFQKRFSLSADERIKSRRDFEQLYSSGRTIYSPDKRIKAIYLITSEANLSALENTGVKIAAVVSKKAGIAVWRNRVKRLIKEAYRLNKEVLTGICSGEKILIKVILSPGLLNEKKNKNIKLNEVMPGVIEVMLKIKSVLQ